MLVGQFQLCMNGIWVVDLIRYLSVDHCRYLSEKVMYSCGMIV